MHPVECDINKFYLLIFRQNYFSHEYIKKHEELNTGGKMCNCLIEKDMYYFVLVFSGSSANTHSKRTGHLVSTKQAKLPDRTKQTTNYKQNKQQITIKTTFPNGTTGRTFLTLL